MTNPSASSGANPPYTVYMHTDSAGQPLYVGCTKRLRARTKEHHQSQWWTQVAEVRVIGEWPQEEALAKERELILEHRPPFNTTHRPDEPVFTGPDVADWPELTDERKRKLAELLRPSGRGLARIDQDDVRTVLDAIGGPSDDR